MLSGLTEGLSENITPFVERSNLMLLLFYCIQDPISDVRLSSFALLGELTKACFVFVEPLIGMFPMDNVNHDSFFIGSDKFMPALIQNLNITHISVCNNATWAIGEISVKYKEKMKDYVPAIMPQLIVNLNQPETPRTLLENTGQSLNLLE